MPALDQTLHIDLAAIPDFRRIELAKGALALTEQVFSMPGAEERYQAWLQRAQGQTKKDGQGRPIKERSKFYGM